MAGPGSAGDGCGRLLRPGLTASGRPSHPPGYGPGPPAVRRLPLYVLLVFTLLLLAIGATLLAVMVRRDDPALGVAGVGLMIAAGVPGAVYAVLDSF